MLPNTDDGPGKDLWLRHGWAERPIDQEQLYDLVFDPMEMVNVIDRPELEPVAEEMRARLAAWMAETGDPLLDGPVAPPPGAEYNEQGQVSAREPTRVTPPGAAAGGVPR